MPFKLGGRFAYLLIRRVMDSSLNLEWFWRFSVLLLEWNGIASSPPISLCDTQLGIMCHVLDRESGSFDGAGAIAVD